MTRCAVCGRGLTECKALHEMNVLKHGPDPAIPVSRVRELRDRVRRYAALPHAHTFLDVVHDIEALLRDAGVEPDAIRRGGE